MSSFSKINLVKQIDELKDYRGYKRILVIKADNVYMGYLDGDYFGYTVPEGLFMTPEQVVDYYFKNFHPIFHNSEIEYNEFNSKETYRPYITALKYKLEKSV